MPISSYSTIPGNNNAAPPNGAPEGMAAGQVNNVIRQIMADIRTFYDTLTQSGNFTGTLTGMTGATTVTVFYSVTTNGYCCLRSAGGTGTSNTNQMTMTGVPAACQPAAFLVVPCGQIADNGDLFMGYASISGGTITFAVDRTDSVANRVQGNSVSFTPSGAKGLGNGWCLVFPVA